MYLIGTITQQLQANSPVIKLRYLCADMSSGSGTNKNAQVIMMCSQVLYTGFINVNSRTVLHYPSSFSYKGKFCCKKIKCAQWRQLLLYFYKNYCSKSRNCTIYFHRNALIHTLHHKHEHCTLTVSSYSTII